MGFRTLLFDPPWDDRGSGKIKRGADRHYPTLKTREIAPVIRASRLFLPADHAHMWMWVTSPRLPDGLEVIDALGFDYKTNVPWVKTRDPLAERCLYENGAADPKLQIGLGQYTRGSHELLLFATRGKGQHESVWHGARNIPSVIFGKRTKHSAKPPESYDLIESISKGPRIEFFARAGRVGWTSAGNQLDTTESNNNGEA